VTLFRARARRQGTTRKFDPLDSSGSVAGPRGWRFNDLATEVLYTAEVEALAILEVAIRPGFDTIAEILIATIDVPDDSVVGLDDIDLKLPADWDVRPAADDSRKIARGFLDVLAAKPAGRRPVGLRVPSVLSGSDFNVLLDPSRKAEFKAKLSGRIPFGNLRMTGS
jgi:RES domain-containing protein